MNDLDLMLKSIYNVPEDIEEIRKNLKKFYLPSFEFKNITFLGTGGGSRASFDLLKSYLFDISKYPIDIYQGYEIPEYIDKNSLVIVCSYSGDTEETISSFNKALLRGCKIIAFSKNGELEKISKKFGINFIKLKDGYEARQALHLIFFSILTIIEKIFNLDFSIEVDDLIKALKVQRDEKNEEIDSIAKEMIDKIPIIYGSCNLTDSIGERFRRQLNENGKTISHSNFIPSLHHDEIVGYMDKRFKDLLYIIFLRDYYENEIIKKRFDITKNLLNELGFKTKEIYPENSKSKLTRIFSLIMKVDLISLKFANLRGFNPKDVEIIKKLKELMKNG